MSFFNKFKEIGLLLNLFRLWLLINNCEDVVMIKEELEYFSNTKQALEDAKKFNEAREQELSLHNEGYYLREDLENITHSDDEFRECLEFAGIKLGND